MSGRVKQKSQPEVLKLIERASQKIRMIRKMKKITQEELAFQTGLNIYRYESGKSDMKLSTLGILSGSLGVEPWELLK